ncbi:MAG: PspC domain-containing protein [Frankiaceae bacterium]|nr:PspC domain-containing protein [Frankiaceae bacterium]
MAGVAAGLSDHLGVDVLLLRVGFVVTIVLGGLGVLLYGAFWAVVPQTPEDSPRTNPTPRGQLIAFAALALAMLVIAQLIGFGAGLLWPAAIAVSGGAVLWRQADESRRESWRRLTARGARIASTQSRSRTALRYSAGLSLVFAGVVASLVANGSLTEIRHAFLPLTVLLLGLVLVAGPWGLQAVSQLNEERTVRIREQERVELAGRVHDSMLQTLTLIQRRADDPAEVRRLVRRSQREIRGWLYQDTPAEASVKAAVSEMCAEIEDEYRITIDLVTVGDTQATTGSQPLLQALREATINAAKHSGQPTIDVYLEVAASEVVAFVRDRGPGFDPDSVGDDRFGVRESIVARMKRHGGDASIRSTPKSGTEVQLTLPVRPTVDA